MLEQVTLETFAGQVNTRFKLHAGEEATLDLELARAVSLGRARNPDGREPFSLIFRGVPTVRLSQGTYRLEHETLGTLDIFLVPVGPMSDPHAFHYEAIFN